MAGQGHGDTAHHIIPFGTYVKIFAILIGLTIITVAAARFDDFGHRITEAPDVLHQRGFAAAIVGGAPQYLIWAMRKNVGGAPACQ